LLEDVIKFFSIKSINVNESDFREQNLLNILGCIMSEFA